MVYGIWFVTDTEYGEVWSFRDKFFTDKEMAEQYKTFLVSEDGLDPQGLEVRPIEIR